MIIVLHIQLETVRMHVIYSSRSIYNPRELFSTCDCHILSVHISTTWPTITHNICSVPYDNLWISVATSMGNLMCNV